MGVTYEFLAVLGVPAEGIMDESGRSILEQARANAAQEYPEEADQDLVGHLDDLVPPPLRAYEGGTWCHGGDRILVVGKAVLRLEGARGLLGWDLAGPLDAAKLAEAQREVAEGLAKLRGAAEPRLILLGSMY